MPRLVHDLSLPELPTLVCVDGWPGHSRRKCEEAALLANRDYLDEVRWVDIRRVDGIAKDPERVSRFLRTLARNTATCVSVATMAKDVGSTDPSFSEETAPSYLAALALSLAHKRRLLVEFTKTVIDGDLVAVQIDARCSPEVPTAFRDALALKRQLRRTLHALYQGWIGVLNAFRTAKITGTFAPPATLAAAADRPAALRQYRRLDKTITAVYLAARKETQMSRRVEMNTDLARLPADREAVRARL